MIVTSIVVFVGTEKEDKKTDTEETSTYVNKLEEELQSFKESQAVIDTMTLIEINEEDDIASDNIVSLYSMYGIIQNVVKKDGKNIYVFLGEDMKNYFLSAIRDELKTSIADEYEVTIESEDFENFEVFEAQEKQKKDIENALKNAVDKYKKYHEETNFAKVNFS